MSHGKRTPEFLAALYSTIGAESLVSHPSTRTWKKRITA